MTMRATRLACCAGGAAWLLACAGFAAPHGFALHSVKVSLPEDRQVFPGGKDADAVNGNCLTCHSAAMVLTQPKLPPAVWQTEITKMIKVYKAPVADSDVPAILAYLSRLSPGR